MTSLFTKRQRLPTGALLATAALHIVSLCVLVRFYGPSFVFEFGKGFVKIYWGGGEEFRNSCVYNAGEWPLRPETRFAGGYLAEGQIWEAYGPSLILDRQFFSERVQHQGMLEAFGYAVPQLRHDGEAASVMLPLGTFALAVELGALSGVLWGWRPKGRPGEREPADTSLVLRGPVPGAFGGLRHLRRNGHR